MDYSKLITAMDKLASVYEEAGMVDEAYRMDIISNSMEKLADDNLTFDEFMNSSFVKDFKSKKPDYNPDTFSGKKEQGKRVNPLSRREYQDIIFEVKKALKSLKSPEATSVFSLIEEWAGKPYITEEEESRIKNKIREIALKMENADAQDMLSLFLDTKAKSFREFQSHKGQVLRAARRVSTGGSLTPERAQVKDPFQRFNPFKPNKPESAQGESWLEKKKRLNEEVAKRTKELEKLSPKERRKVLQKTASMMENVFLTLLKRHAS